MKSKFIVKIYNFISHEKRINFFRKIDSIFRKIGGKLYTKTLGQLKHKLRYNKISKVEETIENDCSEDNLFETLCWKYEHKTNKISNPLVSIIVPNYNHGKFLRERLDSIYSQTYKNYEVILLDDCSNDNSVQILEEYKNKYSTNTRSIFNVKNEGRVFKQWNKGLSMAKGELIWIAESDDFCEKNFLETMVSLFCYDSVMLAFARSVFVQDGEKIWSTEEYLHDLRHLKWDAPFYMSANNIVKNGFAIHNIIPNVSSALFRNIGKVPEEIESICENMRLSSDWVFYLYMIRGSIIAYTNETTNYYRIHPQSTSLKIQKTYEYYSEFEQVSCFIAKNYDIDVKTLTFIKNNLEEHYKNTEKAEDDSFAVEDYYSINKILKYTKERDPNIIMACYALRSGGGETYPIHLANELIRQGYTVTILNFNFEESEERIVELINNNVPVVNLKHTDHIWSVIHDLGGGVIHSHHASVDYALSLWINSNPDLAKHIITLHGMYEAIEKEDCTRVINETIKSVYKYVYIADKNLECFTERKKFIKEKFVKMANGLPQFSVEAINRESLGINSEDFVLVLASRGIPEKGWEEAIEATKIANDKCYRKIHLVILGDGECREQLEKNSPEYIHFMGTVSNVRSYYCMGDVGLLPSRFKGESYPLVVMECLMTGKPVISTNIAEVPNQIRGEDGTSAGLLIPLEKWSFSIEDLSEAILKLANDIELYNELKKNTFSASIKFDIEKIVKEYLALYHKAVK